MGSHTACSRPVDHGSRITETEMNIQEIFLEEAGAWFGQTEESILVLHYPAAHVAVLSSPVGGLGHHWALQELIVVVEKQCKMIVG